MQSVLYMIRWSCLSKFLLRLLEGFAEEAFHAIMLESKGRESDAG